MTRRDDTSAVTFWPEFVAIGPHNSHVSVRIEITGDTQPQLAAASGPVGTAAKPATAK